MIRRTVQRFLNMNFLHFILLTAISVFLSEFVDYATSEENKLPKELAPLQGIDVYGHTTRRPVELPDSVSTITINNDATIMPETDREYKETGKETDNIFESSTINIVLNRTNLKNENNDRPSSSELKQAKGSSMIDQTLGNSSSIDAPVGTLFLVDHPKNAINSSSTSLPVAAGNLSSYSNNNATKLSKDLSATPETLADQVSKVTQNSSSELIATSKTLPDQVSDVTHSSSSDLTATSKTLPDEVSDVTHSSSSDLTATSKTLPDQVSDVTQTSSSELTATSETLPDQVSDVTHSSSSDLNATLPDQVSDVTHNSSIDLTATSETLPDQVSKVTQNSSSDLTATSKTLPDEVSVVTYSSSSDLNATSKTLPDQVSKVTQNSSSELTATSKTSPDQVSDVTHSSSSDLTATSKTLADHVSDVTHSSSSDLPVTARAHEEISINATSNNGYGASSLSIGEYTNTYAEVTTKSHVLPSETINNGIENDQYLQNVSSILPEEPISPDPGTSESIKVIVVHKKSISLVFVSEDEVIKILESIDSKLYSFDYIYNDNLIFFTDNSSIYRATFNNSVVTDIEPIVNERVDGPVRLAVDWIHKRLYWMTDRHQAVMSADLDGNNVSLLLDSNDITMNFAYPNNIVVDPCAGLIFFVNNYVIYKYDLIKGNLDQMNIDNMEPGKAEFGVRAITLDKMNKMIYISGLETQSPAKYYLGRIDYEAEEVMQDFNMNGLNDIHSMDVLGDTLYFAHYMDDGYVETKSCADSLMSMNKNFDRASLQKLFQPEHCRMGIKNIKVFHKSAQDVECNGNFGAV